ncbi:SSI family serine proteinase inhibitor [Spirillospora sp. NPDC052242]
MPHTFGSVLVGAALALLPVAHSESATSLRLTLKHPGREGAEPRTATLRCDPHGGRHPDAMRACADLAESGGRFEHEPDGRMCTAIHSPVAVRAEGTWRGRPVRFRKTYPNDCVMRSRTGMVFAF